jgi:soluble lytic murein transglycosylase-like protein
MVYRAVSFLIISAKISTLLLQPKSTELTMEYALPQRITLTRAEYVIKPLNPTFPIFRVESKNIYKPKADLTETHITSIIVTQYKVNAKLATLISKSILDVCSTLKTEYAMSIQPYEIMGIMSIESDFNIHSTSEVGAVGLMQLTNPCIEDIVKPLHLVDADMNDIHSNILMGTYYYAINKYKHGLDKALVIYNQGYRRLNSATEYCRNKESSYLNKVKREQQRFKEELNNAKNN